MFRNAYEHVSKFTFPVVQYVLTGEGKCSAAAATFIVVNEDGWIITAAHVMTESINLGRFDAAARAFEARRDAIRADLTLSNKERSKQLAALGPFNKKGARRGTSSWGFSNVQLVDVSTLDEADLAVGRLSGFDKKLVAAYPTFADPGRIDFRPGASLCKLGYPFVELTPTYDEAGNRFSVPAGQDQIARFPIEGIYTRDILIAPPNPPPPFRLMYLETSSPGLRGQSGGPTFDSDGTIWAIQSRTAHLPLGFSPEIKHAGRVEKEHQFLNVGMGVHAETVLGFLNQVGVAHSVA